MTENKIQQRALALAKKHGLNCIHAAISFILEHKIRSSADDKIWTALEDTGLKRPYIYKILFHAALLAARADEREQCVKLIKSRIERSKYVLSLPDAMQENRVFHEGILYSCEELLLKLDAMRNPQPEPKEQAHE